MGGEKDSHKSNLIEKRQNGGGLRKKSNLSGKVQRLGYQLENRGRRRATSCLVPNKGVGVK